MIILFLFYLPSLIGLFYLTNYFLQLMKASQLAKSKSVPLFTALFFVGSGLIVSWVVVLQHAALFLQDGRPLLSYEVLFLPLFWAILLIPVNRRIRK